MTIIFFLFISLVSAHGIENSHPSSGDLNGNEINLRTVGTFTQIDTSDESGSDGELPLDQPETIDNEERKNKCIDFLYQQHFYEFLSHSERIMCKKQNIIDPTKATLLSCFNQYTTIADLDFLDECLQHIKYSRYSASAPVRLAFIQEASSPMCEESRNLFFNGFQHMLTLVEKADISRYVFEGKAAVISHSLSELFKIPNIMRVDPMQHFAELYYAHKNFDLAVIQLKLMEIFYTGCPENMSEFVNPRSSIDAYFNFLHPYLIRMCDLQIFFQLEMMTEIAGHFCTPALMSRMDVIIHDVHAILRQLDKRPREKAMLTRSQDVLSIISLVNDISKSVKLSEFNLARLFVDLHYTNRDINLTELLLEIIREFLKAKSPCTQSDPHEGIDIYQCRRTLEDVTEAMMKEFFFSGKIARHILTRDYFTALLGKLELSRNRYLRARLSILFPVSDDESIQSLPSFPLDPRIAGYRAQYITDTSSHLATTTQPLAASALRIDVSRTTDPLRADTPLPFALLPEQTFITCVEPENLGVALKRAISTLLPSFAPSAGHVYKSAPFQLPVIPQAIAGIASQPNQAGSYLHRSASSQQNPANIFEGQTSTAQATANPNADQL